MKSAISPDIWETKRMLITKLYKDEEWPLKQVIKLVQTRDFHPSESQLRSRLKKWHITKPSRKKYDGSRRLSGAKKNNAQKRPSESHSTLPSSSTYNTLQSHQHQHPLPLPSRKTDESDSFSEARSDASRPSVSVSIPEMSTSPANRYILPSSPHDETQLTPAYGSNSIINPSTPITPAVYGMDDTKRALSDAGHTIYFYPQDSSPSIYSNVPVSASFSYPHTSASFGPFLDPTLAAFDHQTSNFDAYQHQNAHYVPSTSQPKTSDFTIPIADLPPPLLDGWVNPYQAQYQPQSPAEVYSRQQYFHEDSLQPLAPPIYQAM
ncbi:Clr5 domain-containing protein [Aspergillus undulatus]|uniref:Clr5 domain-containing protein n=1 Tax=Aspergillus undulatus TaxID=1810928 RepID=UPI003CCD3429